MTAPVPTVRPFRALRYDQARVGDLSAVICPPYDVISPADRERLLARHPRNAVRVELPVAFPAGGAAVRAQPADPYRRAARTLLAWRRDGTLRRDEAPSLYAYEQRYCLPGEDAERTQRSFFGALLLEPLGAGIRPHERTMSGPKEDRLRLLRATATNTSPIVVLAVDRAGRMRDALRDLDAEPPMADATDDSRVRHRLWAVASSSEQETALVAGVGEEPLTIADGHHRYETALRYRDERRSAGERGADEPFDYVLALVLAVGADEGASRPTVLPTHRLVAGDVAPRRDLVERAEAYFTLTRRAPQELVRSFSPPLSAGGRGRFGLLVAGRGYELVARWDAVAPLFGEEVPAAVRRLDVAVLDAFLSALLEPRRPASPPRAEPHEVSAAVVGRLSYTHDASAAWRAVEAGESGAAFLVEPTPVSDVVAVAAAGALMPHKSTYFYPKAATGLVMNPLE